MKCISEETHSILDVKHLEVFLVNNMDHECVLWDTARNFNIDPPEVIQCNFATTLVKETRSISNYESVLIPVMNMLLEHEKNFIVSAS